MIDKIRLTSAVIVEGKYDKMKLQQLLDCVIIQTDGFRIFKNKDTRKLISNLAHSCGIIVLTDCDRAGFLIRGHLSGIVQGGNIRHVYIPEIIGKEKRKHTHSAERKLGVEGMELAVLTQSLQNAGIIDEYLNPTNQTIKQDKTECITASHLYESGLTGGENSSLLRQNLFKKLDLPTHLTAKAALPLLNNMLTLEQFQMLVAGGLDL